MQIFLINILLPTLSVSYVIVRKILHFIFGNSKSRCIFAEPKHKIMTNGKQIAAEILQQLGGNKFIAMTGAKNLGYTEKGLQFKIMKNESKVTHVVINLNETDTYNMEFVRCVKFDIKPVKQVSGIYCDQLQEIFTKVTGLNTRL